MKTAVSSSILTLFLFSVTCTATAQTQRSHPDQGWAVDKDLGNSFSSGSAASVFSDGTVLGCVPGEGCTVYDPNGLPLRTLAEVGCQTTRALGDSRYLCVDIAGTLSVYSAIDNTLEGAFGTLPASGAGSFRLSLTSREGTVLVRATDLGLAQTRVRVFGADGQVHHDWTVPMGSQPGQLSENDPRSAALNDEFIFFGESTNLDVYSIGGTFLRRTDIGVPAFQLIEIQGRLLYGELNSQSNDCLGGRIIRLLDAFGRDKGFLCNSGNPLGWAGVDASGRLLSRRPVVGWSWLRPVYRTAGRVLVDSYPPRVDLRHISPRLSSNLVDIEFEVFDPDTASLQVAGLAFSGEPDHLDGMVPIRSLVEGTVGGLGSNVATGTTHDLVWDPLADGVPGPVATLRVKIMASDTTDLMDLGFATLPSDVPSAGDAELQITTVPIGEEDVRRAMFWLIAIGDPEVELVGSGSARQIRGTQGAFDGVSLFEASSNLSTQAGRDYLFTRMGVDEATPEEVARAREGSTAGVEEIIPVDRTFSGRPVAVNEVGIEMKVPPNAGDIWLVRR